MTRKQRSATSKGAASSGPVTLPDGLQLGTLPSELDEPARLPAAFDDFVYHMAELTNRYDRAELSARQFAHQLSLLRVRGPDGSEWTAGATTRRWYCRYPGGSWLPTVPPDGDDEGWGDAVVTTAEPFKTAAVMAQRPGDEPGWVDPDADPPWPEAHHEASTVDLPDSTSGVAVDEHGVWDHHFSSPDHQPGNDPTTTGNSADSVRRPSGLPDELFG